MNLTIQQTPFLLRGACLPILSWLGCLNTGRFNLQWLLIYENSLKLGNTTWDINADRGMQACLSLCWSNDSRDAVPLPFWSRQMLKESTSQESHLLANTWKPTRDCGSRMAALADQEFSDEVWCMCACFNSVHAKRSTWCAIQANAPAYIKSGLQHSQSRLDLCIPLDVPNLRCMWEHFADPDTNCWEMTASLRIYVWKQKFSMLTPCLSI